MKRIDESKRLRFAFVIGSLLALMLVLIVSYRRTDYESEFLKHLIFQGEIAGQGIEFKLWEDESQECYYLFLPSCFQKENISLSVNYDGSLGRLNINNVPFSNGTVFDNICDGNTYQVQIRGPFGLVCAEKSMQVLISENLPTVMITAQAEELFALEDFENKKYAETGDLLILDERGGTVCDEELERFKIRGNLTAQLDKKPYSFTLKSSREFLGMQAGQKWNLLANATDTSYIRNKVVLDMANSCMDAYEPEGTFVDLFINGEYRGNYLLTEAVNIEENRLMISETDEWFLEMELDFRLEEETPYVVTQRGQIFTIHTKQSVTDAEKRQIKVMLDDIESALYSENGISEVSGKTLEELIDFDSWAEAWLVQEISGDHDTGIASQFAYTRNDKNVPLYAGPVWDYDGSMGNVNTAMFQIPEALTTSISQTRTNGNANQNRWLSAMYKNEDFKEVIKEKYINHFSPYLDNLCSRIINEYKEKIRKSAKLDAVRWHEKRLSWSFVLPEGIIVSDEGDYQRFDTLECSIDMVKDFLIRKKDFLDKLWVEQREFCIVEIRNDAPFLNADYNQTMYYWVEKGTAIENLPSIQESGYIFCGYTDCSSGEKIQNGTLIYADCTIEGKWIKMEEE